MLRKETVRDIFSPIVLKSWMGGMDWIDLAQDRDRGEGSCEYSKETSGLNKMPGIS
jgi:hypothetical protein